MNKFNNITSSIPLLFNENFSFITSFTCSSDYVDAYTNSRSGQRSHSHQSVCLYSIGWCQYRLPRYFCVLSRRNWSNSSRILTLSHFALGIKYRTWFFSTLFCLGGIGIWPLLSKNISLTYSGEVIGYIGRTGSAFDVTLNLYFIMQIVCLIIAPAFFSAGLYLTMGNLYLLS